MKRAFKKLEKQRRLNRSKPLSRKGLRANIAMQYADEILDEREGVSYDDEEQAVA